MVPRLLILGHGAERTGPPIFLLRLLRWVRAHAELEVAVVLLDGGPLLDDIRALAPTFVAGVNRLGDVPPADVAYVNTAGSIRLLDHLPAPPGRVVTHLHELSTGLEAHLRPEDLQRILDVSERILVVSDAVASDLAARTGTPEDRLTIVPGFVPDELLTAAPAVAPEAADAMARGPLVLASGTLDWRKGVDLFVEACALVAQVHPTAQFGWVGGDLSGPAAVVAAHRVAATGLGDRIRFHGEQPEPAAWFRGAHVFVLASREDAFPLVCLEAAAVGVPTVCFAGGGITSFVRTDAGVVVPFPDREAMADAVLGLLADEPRRQALGATARQRVADHHVVGVVAPVLLDHLVGPTWRAER